MELKPFSKKQLLALTWWCEGSPFKDRDAVICDGAVRSGKTLCMGISFVVWAFYRFSGASFAICGKTIRSLKRNLITTLIPALSESGFSCNFKVSENLIEISYCKRHNRLFLFGGKDESSASLIQGITLSGVFFDEAALMPRSFIEQALARCSVEGSKFWFNCNPDSPNHWFYREWILKARSRNALYLHFTMEDNPSLGKEIIERYKSLYTGPFYERFILGKWVASEGLIYPFMTDKMFCGVPREGFSRFAASCDYGTVNPCSIGLWGKSGGTWYRIDEYYFDSRRAGFQKTDEEHYAELEKLCGNRKIGFITVDPSAASFMETIRRHGKYRVRKADNSVIDGIRQTCTALKSGKIKICRCCADSIREFGLYRWAENGKDDAPVKENDHAMDDIRYFVTAVLKPETSFFAAAVSR